MIKLFCEQFGETEQTARLRYAELKLKVAIEAARCVVPGVARHRAP
jgi:hypothetical protein